MPFAHAIRPFGAGAVLLMLNAENAVADDPRALGPPSATGSTSVRPSPIQRSFVELGGGYGSSGYDLGLMGRAGITFSNHVAIAFSITYHDALGLPTYSDTAFPTLSYFTAAIVYLGPEIGYDFEVGPLVVRPYAAIALGLMAPPHGTTSRGPATWIGVRTAWDIPDTRVFVGVDLRGEGMIVGNGNANLDVTGTVDGFLVAGVWFRPSD